MTLSSIPHSSSLWSKTASRCLSVLMLDSILHERALMRDFQSKHTGKNGIGP